MGISSTAALRGNRAASYAASKAFQSVYLDGLRDLARHSGHPIAVTEVQPGAVDTAMLKPDPHRKGECRAQWAPATYSAGPPRHAER